MLSTLALGSLTRASTDCVSSELAGETVILSLADGKYYGIDSVGSRVWELLQDARPFVEIRDTIAGEFGVGTEQCTQDLLHFVGQLREHGLVEVVDAGAS